VEPWWFFLPLLLLGVLPWALPALRACRSAWREGAAADATVRALGGAPPFRPLRFLLIYAGVTLVFFSLSGSKLAPYILPMMPVLAALTGVFQRDPAGLARNAARVGAVLVPVVAVGLLIYSARRNSYVPLEAARWAVAAVAIALAGAALTWRRRLAPMTSVLVAVISATLAWQCLLYAYSIVPPARSARDLVSAVRPYIGPQTRLYSVGQYRETVSPYLGRTLQLVGYEGELRFGQDEEPQRRMSTGQFAERWSSGGEAVAFFDPGVWDTLRRQGLPGRVIATDNYTVAVSRL
jgi:4-amino-4-deoxy-L-arabinose transferase-like glycosyltransferase